MDTIGFVSPSFLDQRFKLSDLLLVVIKKWLGVGDSKDDFGLGESVSQIESRVSAFFKRLFEESVELSLEKTIIDVLFESVLCLGG